MNCTACGEPIDAGQILCDTCDHALIEAWERYNQTVQSYDMLPDATDGVPCGPAIVDIGDGALEVIA